MITIHQARQTAVEMMPFAARAILSMQPVASDKLPETAILLADDEWNLYYSAKWFDSANGERHAANVAAVRICIEVARLLQRHPQRLKKLIPDKASGQQSHQKLANRVSTAVANDLVKLDEWIPNSERFEHVNHLPYCEYIAEVPQLCTLENVYRTILRSLPKNNGSNSTGGQGMKNPFGQQPQPSPPSSHQGHDPVTKEQADCESDICGSACDGIPREWETARKQGKQDPRDPQSFQVFEQQIAEEQDRSTLIKQTAFDAQKHFKDIGCAPSQQMKDFIAEETRVPPRQIGNLMSVIRHYTETQSGYQFRRFDGRNKRQSEICRHSGEEITIAKFYAPKLEIMIVLDTSGSMNQRDSRIALLHIASVLQSLQVHHGATLYLGTVAPERREQGFTPRDAASMSINGCGGTDMARCITESYKSELNEGGRPDLILCVTDCYTHWRMEELPVPLVIAGIPEQGSSTLDLHKIMLEKYPVPEWAIPTMVDVERYEHLVS